MRTAFHLRCGEYDTVRMVDAWLRQHHYEVAGCHDVFDACTHLILNTARPAEFVFIGTDWFEPDDCAIIDYVRLSWPSCGLIVYGVRGDLSPGRVNGLAACIDSRAALQQVLGLGPDELVRHLRILAQVRASDTRSDAADNGRPLLHERLGIVPIGEHLPVADVQSFEQTARDMRADVAPAAPSQQPVLTRAELAALLGDD
ncbi:MAG: hypothetical protein JXO22_16090 [Phycisphaerae bacterium]|nr:hypothetical protein [Phycisphaerae bacterium]